jgi:DNA-binding NtrC family response regulator
VHARGPRRAEAFVDLNCASLSRELLESELFGHEAGAFTGATKRKLGLLEVAHRGTAFLDEIGDMDAAIQPRLLKVIEERRLRRVGDIRDQLIDVALIAATHQDLRRLMAERRFREDLYFRITCPAAGRPALAGAPGRHPAPRAALRGSRGGRARARADPDLRSEPWGTSAPMPGPATCASCATSSRER